MIRAVIAFAVSSLCITGCSQSGQQAPADHATPAGQAAPAGQGAAGQTSPAAAPSSASSAPAPQAAPAGSRQTAAAPSTSPATSQGASQLASAPAAAPQAAAFKEVTIPAGTTLSVSVLSSLASNTSKVEDPVKGSLSKDVRISGTTALPAGTQVTGSVLEANESGRVKGRAAIAFRFDRLLADGETVRIQTSTVRREAAQDKKSDVTKGGIGAGLGAIVGGVVGGGKGAAIGAVAGGTGAVLATKGKEVEIPSGTVVSVRLQEPLTVNVPVR
jgi:hypothetical protein